MTAEWTTEKWVDKRVQSKQMPKLNTTEKTDGRKFRQTLAPQVAKGSLSNNAKRRLKMASWYSTGYRVWT